MSGVGKITRDTSLAHADKILQELRKIWPKSWEGWLECWSNSREQGYHLRASIWNATRDEYSEAACVFGESRYTDSALVVVGRTRDFDLQTHQPSAKVWNSDNRAYFEDMSKTQQKWTPKLRGRGDKRAAKWVVKRLRERMAEDLEDSRKRLMAYEESLRQTD
jgi:hypothetical protein